MSSLFNFTALNSSLSQYFVSVIKCDLMGIEVNCGKISNSKSRPQLNTLIEYVS